MLIIILYEVQSQQYHLYSKKYLELKTGIEPVTSPLPRECSTTEPLELIILLKYNGAGDAIRTRDIQLGRLALYQLSYARIFFGGERWIRTIEGKSRQIYSLMPLAARQSRHFKHGAGYRT